MLNKKYKNGEKEEGGGCMRFMRQKLCQVFTQSSVRAQIHNRI